MFTMITTELPLPMPRTVIWSPSHTMNIVEVVMVSTVSRRKGMPQKEGSTI